MVKKKHIFYSLYMLNIIFIFGFGQLRLPVLSSFNLYQLSTISLILYCAFIDRTKFWDKYQSLFWTFYAIFGVCSFATGGGDNFMSTIVRKVFSVVSIYWSTKVLISKYNTLLPLLIPVCFIGILDSIVTICQCFRLHYFDSLTIFLETINDDQIEYMDRRDVTFGVSLNGIYANPVHNGLNLMFFFLTSLILLKQKFKIAGIIPPAIIFGGLFFCQQRAGFFLSIIGFFLIMREILKRGFISKTIFRSICFLGCIILLLNVNIDTVLSSDALNDTRLFDLDYSGRERLNEASLDYILQHPILGGHYVGRSVIGNATHNLFFDAFLSGGLFGGLLLFYMIYLQIKTVRHSWKSNNEIVSLIFSVVFLSVLGNSFTHNTGYVQADSVMWLSWALCVFSIEKNNNYNNRQVFV